MTILLIILWYLVGLAAPIYFMMRDFNDLTGGLIIGFVAGLVGPFAWAIGIFIHNIRGVRSA